MKDSNESFQAPVTNLVVVMYVRIVDNITLALVEVDICARSSLLMAWVLQYPSCCLKMDFLLYVRRVFVNTAYTNHFFRSNKFISSTDPGM